jgi:hypothetical protein
MCSDNSDSTGVGSGTDGTRRTFAWDESLQPSTAVVEAVAAATDRDATELEPIHESVDADALDTLIDPAGSSQGDPIQISFRYEGVAVVLDNHRGIEIRSVPADDVMPE